MAGKLHVILGDWGLLLSGEGENCVFGIMDNKSKVVGFGGERAE